MNNKGVNNFGDDGKKLDAARRAAEAAKANKAKGNEKAEKKAETQKTSADKGIDATSVGQARLAMQGQKGKDSKADPLMNFLNELEGPRAFTDAEVKKFLDLTREDVKDGKREPDFTEQQLISMFELDEVPTGRIDLNNPFALKRFMAMVGSAKHEGNLASDLDINTPQGRQRQADLLRNIIDPRNSGRNAA